jgi:hypothetical protein
MRSLALMLLLSACAPTPTYILVGCPASDGWTHDDHVRLAAEFPAMQKQFPETARALTEYSELKPNRCAYFSGLKEYE